MTTPFREQRIAPEEVRRVVKNATDLAAREGANESPLTQEELEHHAGALGIAPRFVRQAQQSGDAHAAEATHFWTGGPVPVLFESEVSRELDEQEQSELIDTVQFVLGLRGKIERLGGQLTWSPLDDGHSVPRPISVRVLVQRGRTHVRIEERLGGLAGGLIAGVGLGAGVPLALTSLLLGALVLHAPVKGLVLGLALLASLVMSMRWTVRGVVQRRAKQLQDLAHRMRAQLGAMELEPQHESRGTGVRAVDEGPSRNERNERNEREDPRDERESQGEHARMRAR